MCWSIRLNRNPLVCALSLTFWTLLILPAAFAQADQNSSSKLENLRNQYLTYKAQLKQPLTDLGARYLQALQQVSDQLQKNGNLEGVVAVKAEMERFKNEPSPAEEVSDIELLARVQEVYAKNRADILSEIGDDLNKAQVTYREHLKEMISELTTQGNFDQALKVQKILNDLPAAEPPRQSPSNSSLVEGPFGKDLVLYIPFNAEPDGEVLDASGTGNDGSLVGDAKIVDGAETSETHDDDRGFYLSLDGEGDYAEIPHHESLNLDREATVSAWVYLEEIVPRGGIVSKYPPARPSWVLRTASDAGHPGVVFGDRVQATSSEGVLSDRRWAHVVATLKEGTVTIYIDGRLDTEDERPDGAYQNNPASVRIGLYGGGHFLHGAIDDVRVYQRALSRKEVSDLYSMEKDKD